MTIQQMIPTSVVDNSGTYAPTGAASVVLALSELTDPDLTYVRGIHSSQLTVNFADYTLASNERCRAARIRVQANDTAGSSDCSLNLGNDTDNVWSDAVNFTVGATAQYFATPWLQYWVSSSGGEYTQTIINKIQSQFRSALTAGHTADLFKFFLELDVRRHASVAIDPIPTNTRRPIITFTPTIFDGQPQTKFQTRVYNLDVNPTPNATTDTLGLAFDSGQLVGTSTQRQVRVSLGDANYRGYVRVAKDFNGQDWWSNWDSYDFTLHSPPPAPVAVGLLPANGSTVNTDIPVLAVKLAQSSIAYPARVKARWQIASDAGFTTNLKVITEDDIALDAGSTHSMLVPLVSQLTQGTWYIRARAVDEFGGFSAAFSPTNQFTVSHPPGAINLVPGTDKTYIYGDGNVTFTFQFVDTSPVDFLTSADIKIERNLDGTTVLDTGKISESDGIMTVAIPAAEKDVPLRWAVKLWDRDDVSGAWSPYSLFRVGDAPSVTVTGPSVTVDNPQPTITWIDQFANARTQAAWRVMITATDGVIIYQTDWTVGTDLQHTLATPACKNDMTYFAYVFVRDSVGLESSDTEIFQTHWIPPAAPSVVTVDTSNYDNYGHVRVEWDRRDIDADFAAWRVYRRAQFSVSWELVVEAEGSYALYQAFDYLAGAGNTYDYAVVQVASRFATLVESIYVPITVTPQGSSYWLLCPDDFGLSVKLPQTTADDFTDEYESQEMKLIGRGRHVDFGTRWGYNGQLTVEVWDNDRMTAREARQAIERMKRSQFDLRLRNPFGDVIPVVASDIQASRISGVGEREFVTLTIPYLEITDE